MFNILQVFLLLAILFSPENEFMSSISVVVMISEFFFKFLDIF
jgi:hypothetical protein